MPSRFYDQAHDTRERTPTTAALLAKLYTFANGVHYLAEAQLLLGLFICLSSPHGLKGRKNMSGYRKFLKVISVIEIILAVLTLLIALASMGVIALGPELTDQTLNAGDVTITVGQTFAFLGIIALVSGIIDLIVGILGVRGANNPSKIGAYLVLAGIAFGFDLVELVLAIVSLVQGTADASTLISSLISAAVSGALVYVASKIKAEA